MRLPLIACILALFVCLGCQAKATPELTVSDKKKVRILLTNDDGCQSEGILWLKEKLEARGYDVWLSAPATNQSGIGTAITFKPGKEFKVKKIDDKTYCYPGTPSDAMDFGVVGVMRNNPPDLVISGVNDGPNTGMAQVNSGTVGAALRAVRQGYPAIAASIGFLSSERGKGYPSTTKYWPEAVDYVVNMVDEIVAKRIPGQPLLPKGSLISINYPALPKDQIKGVKYAATDLVPGPQFYYELKSNGSAVQVFSDKLFIPSTENNDTGSLDQGYIVHTVLDADWNGPQFIKEYQKLLTDNLLK